MTGPARRCGTCELLTRSATPGLDTFGKCPHRGGWVRTHETACAHHLGERPRPLVRVTMALNGAVVALSLGALILLDVRDGTLLTHAALGVVLALALVFFLAVRRFGLLSEDPKYQVLEESDPPPQDDRWWLDPR